MGLSLTDADLASKLTESLNGLYAGSYLAGVFYGLTTHQTFVYFRRSGNDSIYSRLLVLILWIMDTLHAVLAAVALRQLTQESIINPLEHADQYHTMDIDLLAIYDGMHFFDSFPGMLIVHALSQSLSDSGVRGFYCYRIWRLSRKNLILTSVAAFPVICALVAGLYCASRLVGKTGLQNLDLVGELDATLISICVADSIIAGFLCVLLWNSRSGIKRTNSVISMLILYTVTTGLLTSVVAIATLIIMLTMKETFAYAGAFYMLSKLYFSSLLATLNRREKIRTQMDATTGFVSGPLHTSNSRGLKGAGSELVFHSSKLAEESSTFGPATGRQQNDPEYQIGGVGVELGKNSLHHGHVEIKVETQSHGSSTVNDDDLHSASQAASVV
ncbi:hypothetical protein MSAN_02049800 [Mycena sanguinolenta]|uniref:DUF6534 domain-containing protein n=1 Tax=Mycena sanguinolenta TaxID=230812 RepID=A0A8H7CNN7_9AGAR|nr:hypothetical protein MSAN_02049800 [Mycena sanguinolenta]